MTSVGMMAASRPKVTTKNVWSGADPTAVVDPTAYEMGTVFQINSAITIVGGRIWNPGSQSRTGRTIKLWSTAGVSNPGTFIIEQALPNTLPAGWSSWSFPTPQAVSSGYYCVSYDTGAGSPDYGSIAHAFDAPITTADGKVTMPMSAGQFGGADGMPTGAFNNTFYGVDMRYQ